MLERLQNLPPEQREQILQRMRQRGFDPEAAPAPAEQPAAQPQSAGSQSPRRRAAPAAPTPAAPAGAKTIDSLFGPLSTPETVGRVWLYMAGQLKPVRVRLGISDGTNTELLSDELSPGTELVTAVSLGDETASRTSTGRSPLMPGRPGGGFPGGGPVQRMPGGGAGGARR
jgi:HlyD family secretion protein